MESGLLLLDRIEYANKVLGLVEGLGDLAHDLRRNALLRSGGIEADLWPDYLDSRLVADDDLFLSVDQLERARIAYEDFHKNCPSLELKFCVNLDRFREPDISPPPDFRRTGFDYGFLHSRYSAYSSVLNDIVLGHLSELKGFRSQLNINLLFESLQTLEFVHRTRNRLLREGASLENSDPCFPILVYSYAPDLVRTFA